MDLELIWIRVFVAQALQATEGGWNQDRYLHWDKG